MRIGIREAKEVKADFAVNVRSNGMKEGKERAKEEEEEESGDEGRRENVFRGSLE